MIILKSEREIQKLKQSGQIAAQILESLIEMIQDGITTGDLDEEAQKLMKSFGVKSAFKNYRGFPGHICTSVNEEIVHGIPGKRKLKSGDIISIDIGIKYDGFIGDLAKTAPVGHIDEEKQKLLTVTQQALNEAIKNAIPGNRLHHICQAIETAATKNSYSVVRDYVGHGVGREMHEDPKVPNYGTPKPDPKLLPGMVLAIEPMVNVGTYKTKLMPDNWTAVTADGKPSAHFEHMVAITENGNEVLTCLKKNR